MRTHPPPTVSFGGQQKPPGSALQTWFPRSVKDFIVSMNRKVMIAAVAALSSLALAACGSEGPSSSATGNGGSATSAPAQLSGTLAGSGATSQAAAQTAWIAKYATIQPNVKVSYGGGGSGQGQSDFKSGAVSFAGSDAVLTDADMKAGNFGQCTSSSNALNLPVYISPIAIVFHLDGVTDLNLDAPTTAKIFSGKITTWNDPAIKALNPSANLPSSPISVVHRADKSGTTENFTDTLHVTAPDIWTEAGSQTWPTAFAGESANGTSGVVTAVKNGAGTIGYADESQAKDLSIAKFGTSGNFVGPTAEAAAQVVEASPQMPNRPAKDVSLQLDRKASGYPFVLVSYLLACEEYKDSNTAALVKSYLGYVSSSEGQQVAQQNAGSAPLPSALATKVKDAIDSIK
ncbi:phosphate transport system substrate-binding protein [Propionibacterium cyclohexanicum]|mgnify:CR=1 FL=1|uniref:Phosphate-binding protein n=1 Tax=Propionibacterium cyclohexanicum TaxID=64702 RepID=A0A1H9RT30_9ACTN|nr:phosphate ABC transporter substrate-binding protein PstS [Propionibacterium cyclohexanicum]SER76000.1 phosphate transport system substrate-binding protein [Propionibacterium cyclohexanicum]